ncbi:anthranilate phosphoribosyltransferase [Desulfofalx alkaliphila]|uniref:anthranilate phosphoribosyltransferase n=1 Tax=Desulfofalx alkaliphila TaxID=105483 RepID=UPI0004E10A79|nr:anthranilate phosphoribosyltransferase [Desulfofalx alkaliphila]
MIQRAIKMVVAGRHLDEEQAAAVMTEIMEGRASGSQIASLLTALHLKGETVDEITGFARVMRQMATPIRSSHPLLVDTCGTGGDGKGTFNISTTAAIVLAAAGAKVAKHGNRSVSSRAGSADVLEALKVNINITARQAERCLEEVGICFMFAPNLHGAMKHAAQTRKEIGIRTVFNILGPLTNPAKAQTQVLGVYAADLVEKMAQALVRLGSTRAFVLHGAGGLDEISPVGLAHICEVRAGEVHRYTIDPAEYGFAPAKVEDLAGGDAEENARITKEILAGATGPKRDAVVLNAALGLICSGIVSNLKDGIAVAQRAIDSGAAIKKLEQLVKVTSTMGGKEVISF